MYLLIQVGRKKSWTEVEGGALNTYSSVAFLKDLMGQ